jgi:hypothetical protein
VSRRAGVFHACRHHFAAIQHFASRAGKSETTVAPSDGRPCSLCPRSAAWEVSR